MFVDTFRDHKMTEQLALQIKNEIRIFQHSTQINTFKLTFNSYCDSMFTAYGVYDSNKDLQQRDYSCIYLAYTYVTIQSTAKAIVTTLLYQISVAME